MGTNKIPFSILKPTDEEQDQLNYKQKLDIAQDSAVQADPKNTPKFNMMGDIYLPAMKKPEPVQPVAESNATDGEYQEEDNSDIPSEHMYPELVGKILSNRTPQDYSPAPSSPVSGLKSKSLDFGNQGDLSGAVMQAIKNNTQSKWINDLAANIAKVGSIKYGGNSIAPAMYEGLNKRGDEQVANMQQFAKMAESGPESATAKGLMDVLKSYGYTVNGTPNVEALKAVLQPIEAQYKSDKDAEKAQALIKARYELMHQEKQLQREFQAGEKAKTRFDNFRKKIDLDLANPNSTLGQAQKNQFSAARIKAIVTDENGNLKPNVSRSEYTELLNAFDQLVKGGKATIGGVKKLMDSQKTADSDVRALYDYFNGGNINKYSPKEQAFIQNIFNSVLKEELTAKEEVRSGLKRVMSDAQNIYNESPDDFMNLVYSKGLTNEDVSFLRNKTHKDNAKKTIEQMKNKKTAPIPSVLLPDPQNDASGGQ